AREEAEDRDEQPKQALRPRFRGCLGAYCQPCFEWRARVIGSLDDGGKLAITACVLIGARVPAHPALSYGARPLSAPLSREALSRMAGVGRRSVVARDWW